MSRGWVGGAARALVAGGLALSLAGCTLGSTDDPAATGAQSQQTDAGGTSSEPAGAGGPSAAELSQLVLASAVDPQDESELASVTAALPSTTALTMDVLTVQRLPTGTLVRLRLSSEESTNLGPSAFSDGRFFTQYFIREIYLDDIDGQMRYLPLQFEDYRDGCECPYVPIQLGPEPQVVTAVFPPLPDGVDTVSLSLGQGDLTIDDLPVSE